MQLVLVCGTWVVCVETGIDGSIQDSGEGQAATTAFSVWFLQRGDNISSCPKQASGISYKARWHYPAVGGVGWHGLEKAARVLFQYQLKARWKALDTSSDSYTYGGLDPSLLLARYIRCFYA